MKFVEASFQQDSEKFWVEFIEVFGEDIAEAANEARPGALANLLHQLLCTSIDLLTIAKARLMRGGLDINLMRIELRYTENHSLKLQVVPLDEDHQPIQVNLEMPALIFNPSKEDIKENTGKPGSIVSFLHTKLPGEN